MAKKAKKKTTAAGDAFGIANAQGEPWTSKTFERQAEAELYLSAWSQVNKIALPKHRVVPVRVTVRFTKATYDALSKRKNT